MDLYGFNQRLLGMYRFVKKNLPVHEIRKSVYE